MGRSPIFHLIAIHNQSMAIIMISPIVHQFFKLVLRHSDFWVGVIFSWTAGPIFTKLNMSKKGTTKIVHFIISWVVVLELNMAILIIR